MVRGRIGGFARNASLQVRVRDEVEGRLRLLLCGRGKYALACSSVLSKRPSWVRPKGSERIV